MSTILGIISIILRGILIHHRWNYSRCQTRMELYHAEHVERVWNNIQIILRGYLQCPPLKAWYMEMCFAPQRRTLFRHLNFQQWSEPGVFVHFDLETCFTPQLRAIFHFHRTACLRTCRFRERTFRPSGATNHWKKRSESRLSHLFAHLPLLPSHSFSSLIQLFVNVVQDHNCEYFLLHETLCQHEQH